MKKVLMVLLVGFLSFVIMPPIGANAFNSKVIDEVTESVMQVRGPTGEGSGIVISPKLMLTAYHVVHNKSGIDEAVLVRIVSRHGKEYEAKIVGVDEENDLAMLALFEVEFTEPAVKIASDTEYRLGDKVFSVGYNLQGLERTEANRHLPEKDRTDNPVPRIGYGCVSWIGDSVVYISGDTVSWGSSGGGTFDEGGRLIGVHSLLINDGGSCFVVLRKPSAKIMGTKIKMVPVPVPDESAESKKKLISYTPHQKMVAVQQHIIGYGRQWHTRMGSYWHVREQISRGFIRKDDHGEVRWQRWKDADMPDYHVLDVIYGMRTGVYITEVRKWDHGEDSGGYEKIGRSYNLDVNYEIVETDGKFEVVYKEYRLKEARETYWVCTAWGLVLNMHDKRWSSIPLDLDEYFEPSMKLFNLLWDRWIVPYIEEK